MAFHIPFEHRQQGTIASPIYIGFDTPVNSRTKNRPRSGGWNWWAFFGFPLSLFALVFTVGLLSPVALVLNLIGLRKSPRKLATAGTIISLIGTSIITALAVGGVASEMQQHRSRQHAIAQKQFEEMAMQTRAVMATATAELESYTEDNDGFLPTDIDACILMLKHEDAWGESLRYDEGLDSGRVRSAGPDREFDNNDDIVESVEGKTFRESLLPVN